MTCCLEASTAPPYSANDDPNPSQSSSLGISLELPSFEDYLPTYWPGQPINGKLDVRLDRPAKVSHLRVILYGSVQVFGKQRDMPLSNGLFDYQKNEQLISKGLRIVKRPTSDSCNTAQQHVSDASEYCHSNINEEESGNLSPARENTKRSRWKLNSKQRVDANEPKRQKKENEEFYIQKLVKEIADADFEKDTSHGVIVDDDFVRNFPSDENCTFDLEAKTHHIGFFVTVPMTATLPGSFNHPNYPITYRLVAIMKYVDDNQKETLCYSTTKVCLEPFVDVQSSKFRSCIQSSPTKVSISGSVLRGFYSSLLSSSSMVVSSLLTKSMCPKRPLSINTVHTPPQLRGYLELPRQAFGRSEDIPLKVRLSNTCPNFKISTLKMTVQLLQSINMTCSFGETAEQKAIATENVTLKNTDYRTNSNHGSLDSLNMCLDLSKLMKIPSNAIYSISSKSTREVFSLVHDIKVKLEIEGTLIKRTHEPKAELTEIVYSPHHEDTSGRTVAKNHGICKTYHMELEPLPIVIGYSGYEFKVDV